MYINSKTVRKAKEWHKHNSGKWLPLGVHELGQALKAISKLDNDTQTFRFNSIHTCLKNSFVG